MLLINFIFFIGGMFLEGTALQIMFVPLLYPIAAAVGVDPVAFGVTIVMNIALGTLTPPVGVCVFVASSSGNVPFEEVVQAVMPFLVALIVNILLVIIYTGNHHVDSQLLYEISNKITTSGPYLVSFIFGSICDQIGFLSQNRSESNLRPVFTTISTFLLLQMIRNGRDDNIVAQNQQSSQNPASLIM